MSVSERSVMWKLFIGDNREAVTELRMTMTACSLLAAHM